MSGTKLGVLHLVPAAPAITVYWRPACPYCQRLRRGLRRAGVATSERDIWADDDAAATVRAVAGGDETVPTVEIDGRFLVNPSVRQVLAAVGTEPPPKRWRRPSHPC